MASEYFAFKGMSPSETYYQSYFKKLLCLGMSGRLSLEAKNITPAAT